MRRWREKLPIKYSSLSVKAFALALIPLIFVVFTFTLQGALNSFRDLVGVNSRISFMSEIYVAVILSLIIVALGVFERVTRSDEQQIKNMLVKRLCQTRYGNPLGLRDGQLEPIIEVHTEEQGFRIRVRCPSVEFEKVAALESTISSCLVGEFSGYAVVSKEEDNSSRHVDYIIDDELLNAEKQSVYYSIDDIRRRNE